MSDQQKCRQCQANLPQGAAFCPECGTKAEAIEQDRTLKATGEAGEPKAVKHAPAEPEDPQSAESEATASAAEQKVEEPAAAESAGEPEVAEPAESAVAETAASAVTTAEASASGLSIGRINIKWPFPFPYKPIYLYSALATVAAVLLLVIALSVSGSPSGKHLVYIKDRELQYTDLSAINPFEMTDRLDYENYWYGDDYEGLSRYILTSDNGRYVFYPDRFDYDGTTYFWRDLKADNSASGSATKIDSEINQVPRITKNGDKMFYIKGDDARLYVYDRKSGDRNKLADDVRSFYVNESGTYLVYNTFFDGESAIYEMTLKKLEGERNKLDSDSTIQRAYPDDRVVYYLKEDILYRKEHGKDKERITADVDRVISVIDGKSIYYLKREEVTTNLAGLVQDDFAAGDRELTEPAYPDYPEPPTEPYYSDFATDMWVDSYFGYERHPITNALGYWTEEVDYEAYNEAYDRYFEDYEAWRQEHDRLEMEYNEAYAVYEDKLFRDSLREALNDVANAVTYDSYDLHYWNNGTEELVASDVARGGNFMYYLASSSQSPVVVYQKHSTSTGSNPKLSDLLAEADGRYLEYIIYDLQNRVTAARTVAEETFVAIDGKESILEGDEARNWSIHNNRIYFLDKYDEEKEYGVLTMIPVEKGVLGARVVLDEDVARYRFGNGNNEIYSFKDVKQGSGDLYLDGKVIAMDVHVSSLYNFRDSNTLLYFKDYSQRNEYGTLTMNRGGKEHKIADDVHDFVPIDEKTVAYLTDYSLNRQRGELMLYTGRSKPVLVDSDVTAILWKRGMAWN